MKERKIWLGHLVPIATQKTTAQILTTAFFFTMTCIQKLPEEILRLIFNNSQLNDLQQCQKVCKAWYYPAHVKFLEEIKLCNMLEIDQFIAAIDHNPHKLYLKAVKKINIKVYPNDESLRLNVKKLFFRFHNLEQVKLGNLHTLFYSFDKKVCQTFLRKCPKLQIFDVYCNSKPDNYFDILYNIQPLITYMDLNSAWHDESWNVIEYITSFPRLRAVDCHYSSEELSTIEKHLPVLEKLSDFESIRIGYGEDENEFPQEYLNSKTADEQNMLIAKLAKIKCLNVRGKIFPNAMMFAVKYLTGLEKFSIKTFEGYKWTEEQDDTFFYDVLDLVCRANSSKLDIYRLTLYQISQFFGEITEGLSQQPSKNKATTTLTIVMTNDRDYDTDKAELQVNINQFKHDIKISAGYNVETDNLFSSLFMYYAAITGVDEFILRIGQERRSHEKIDMFMYTKIFQCLVSLKSVVLSIPVLHKDFIFSEPPALTEAHCSGINLQPQVEKLSLHADPCAKFKSLLHYFSFIFPNLKHLEFFYFSGIWDAFIGEYQVPLARFTLDKLVIDATPVKRKLKKCNFFVLVVETLSTFERQVYKIQLDSALPTVCRINHGDLRGHTLGIDFLRVNIIIQELQSLDLMFWDHSQSYDPYYDHDVIRVVIFNNK